MQLVCVFTHVDRCGFRCEAVVLFGASLFSTKRVILVQYRVWVCLLNFFYAVYLLAVAQILQILNARLMLWAFLNHIFVL